MKRGLKIILETSTLLIVAAVIWTYLWILPLMAGEKDTYTAQDNGTYYYDGLLHRDRTKYAGK